MVPEEAVNVSLKHVPGVKAVIVNTALLTSVRLPAVSLTRIRQFVESALGIVHEYVPLSGALAITSVQIVPLSVEYSILTVPLVPYDVHVILWAVPTCQLSPPFGEVTAIFGVGIADVYVALHPAATTPPSDVNLISMLPVPDVNVGGKEVPLYVPSKGADVVDPAYTLTKSYLCSVANEVNVRVIVPPPVGCISFSHVMLLR